ncbi:6-phosphogluconolactonase [Demetria terragena]|uniref:6-phosphogluconolactonase n=1 Tax=Demetria terragena TaxID=63959 RepID=UPI0003692588|nr:6-phosphogluconolactonase [Demetria terragena]
MTSLPAPEVVQNADAAGVADSGAARLITSLGEAQRAGREPHIALTGGSMGSAIIAAVLRRPERDQVDWSRVSVWWGDERYLPAGDPERNDTQNDRAGLLELGLDPDRVHRVPGPGETESVEEAAAVYGASLRSHGAGAFEVAMFGVGPDGHIASLFPHHPAQRIDGEIAVPVHDSPKPPPLRVSLTFEAINRSRQVWFMVAGEAKAAAVSAALAPDTERWDIPAVGARGTEATVWLVDHTALNAKT